ncbi:helix-turn-helix domain-containing protein [Priestia megaterium]|uniref:helix-turn-helix domain-containing protein n=1 Tax=Priestia megaterium TaxID=1404 RepID=UPI001F142BED|nr:helix-turn-helix transcriptional regulator [Priestia megaterium]UMZ35583.1 helix-turn-helix domain-containing protein [Priestia megaterium]
MKTKANLGEILKEQGKTQTEFANEIGYDQSTISKWANGSRTIAKEAKPILARGLDSFKYYIGTMKETVGISLTPYMNGDRIHRDIASMRMLVEKERKEAEEYWKKDFWHIPPEFANEIEREEVRQFIKEYSEKLAAEFNLLAVVCERYGFSLKQIDQQLEMTFRSRGLVK